MTYDFPPDLDRLIGLLAAEIAYVTDELAARRITVQQWREDMDRILLAYIAAALMAGLDSETTGDAQKIADQAIAAQSQYLDGFAKEIEAGGLSEAQIKARAQLYAHSIIAPYWRGATFGLELPAYPGDGSSECLQNDRCTWDIQRAGNDYRCTWLLDPAENVQHCPTCLQRSQEWNPYVVGV